ncbi:serine hydrolase [Sphaerobacter thermophilus]|uniref:beta-lactamase n=1 Tax=Sphaerobacter thermophilus (strain ATCC 49802 / DSM 20745 / KCCM 41009 / NCIMB 13125 / S 6022) TaxID=479434 RepID=D1C8L0_SPHTD|nr:serine hydrolase [Sphaerobacter thermophilus]ACZ40153.1 Beta-lactamase class A-like protein [Sphaerobacter thermophilus DSM 20745]
MGRIRTREEFDRAAQRVVSRFSGELGFAAKNLTTGEELGINAECVLPTASVIKTAVLVELMRQAHEEGLDLQERMTMTASDIVGGSGVLKELGPGLQPTVADVAMLMIIVSDNTATNMLIDRVGGVEAVNRTMQERYGLRSIVLHNRVDFEVIGNDIRRFAEASAADLVRLHEMMARGELINAEACRQMIDVLSRQQYLDQVPRYFNYNQYAKDLKVEQSFTVANKTGFFPGTRVDSGLIMLHDGPTIAFAAMTHRSVDTSMGFESEGAITNGILGRLLLEYWWPGEWDSRVAIRQSLYVDAALAYPEG